MGEGASGGVPAAMAACHTQVTLHPGPSFFMDFFKIPEKILDVDVFLTCEGEIDNQKSYGKGPGFIAKLAHDQKVACIGLCGQLGLIMILKYPFFMLFFLSIKNYFPRS